MPPFKWDSDQQESFEKLKEALTNSPILAYPDYSKPFVLETDASMKGLGAVLSQEDNQGKYRVISFASHALKPFERSMWNYSLAKLELLALKWAICDKFRDYLIGSKFTVLTDNNPLMYVRTSHLGAAQIRWLSDLVLFDFDLKYHVGKLNQAADALSRSPVNPESSSESSHDEEEWETITYKTVCQIPNYHLGSTKLPHHLKHGVQTNITDVEKANKSLGLKSDNMVNIQLRQVKIFNSITPKEMAELQKKDNQLSTVYECVAANSKPKLSEMHCIQPKPVHRLLLQFDQLSLIQGVLHHQTFQDDDEIQQLILPQQLRKKVLTSLHDNNGHQGLQHVMNLLCEKVYWTSMFPTLTIGYPGVNGVLFLRVTIQSPKLNRVAW